MPCHAACTAVGAELSVQMSGRGPASERVCPECEWISTLHIQLSQETQEDF